MVAALRPPVLVISIHAPARGATFCNLSLLRILAFQSTLPRGERPVFLPADFAHVRFQSTLPRGERHRLTIIQHTPFRISIHAPARGATVHSTMQLHLLRFQSTLPRGERQNATFYDTYNVGFQSTLPRGERLHLLTFFRLQYGSILFHLTNKYSPCF